MKKYMVWLISALMAVSMIACSNAQKKDTKDQAQITTCLLYTSNAMPPLNHREPGVIGAARDSDCYVELICDGVHIHPSCVRATFEMFTDKRIVLISDSMMATGMEDGQYEDVYKRQVL